MDVSGWIQLDPVMWRLGRRLSEANEAGRGADGWPFPAILLVASVGTWHVKVLTTYISRMSTNKGNGSVLLVFLKIGL